MAVQSSTAFPIHVRGSHVSLSMPRLVAPVRSSTGHANVRPGCLASSGLTAQAESYLDGSLQSPPRLPRHASPKNAPTVPSMPRHTALSGLNLFLEAFDLPEELVDLYLQFKHDRDFPSTPERLGYPVDFL